MEENKIENLDENLVNSKTDAGSLEEKIRKLNFRLTFLRIISIFLLLVVALFVGITVFIYKNNKSLIHKFAGKDINLASISQISKDKAIDLQKFTDKLAFIDDVVNLLYYYDKDNKKIEDSMFSAYINSLGDKYAEYFPAKQFEEFTETYTEGVYYGIGCLVNQNQKTKDCVVETVYKDSPAEKGGLKKGDIFVSVDGVMVRGDSLQSIVDKIKGVEGAERKITIYRPSEEKELELTCYCGKVDIERVRSEIIDENIGYIDVDEFTGKAQTQFIECIDSLLENNIKGLIIDLRGNPGGELETICSMIDYLVKDRDGRYTLNQEEQIFDVGKTLLVYIKEKGNIVDSAYAADGHSVELPMVVLTDLGTASAAELFTEILRDYKKATIVGLRTYGKGVVQNVIPYDDGSAIKFTVSEYFPPSGYSIDKKGIMPDYILNYDGEEINYDENNNIVVYENNKKYILDNTGGIISEEYIDVASSSEISVATQSEPEIHVENLKIFDDKNNFLDEDWYNDLDAEYPDKQLLQSIVIMRDMIK